MFGKQQFKERATQVISLYNHYNKHYIKCPRRLLILKTFYGTVKLVSTQLSVQLLKSMKNCFVAFSLIIFFRL